uniref:Uncharacterized protein n=1 Tax=Arundo donax TaxID=35708 RepID=A0A0A9GS63_ARUDO
MFLYAHMISICLVMEFASVKNKHAMFIKASLKCRFGVQAVKGQRHAR